MNKKDIVLLIKISRGVFYIWNIGCDNICSYVSLLIISFLFNVFILGIAFYENNTAGLLEKNTL